MRKFTYSRQIVTPEGVETFTASEFDSFEEGQKAVEKGIYDRRLQLPQIKNEIAGTNPPPIILPKDENNKVLVDEKNEIGAGKKT